jgi:hypothetical protein
MTLQQLFDLLPLACSWAAEQERIALGRGVPLTRELIADAKAVGVIDAERVRLFAVETIPTPADPALAAAAEGFGFLGAATVGLCVRYGIYVHPDCAYKRPLIVHELAHTAQYERLGGFEPFLKQYLLECIDPGYPFGALEQEAHRLAESVCRGLSG